MGNEKRSMSENPYTLMPVCGEAFVGRKDLLEELLEGASRHLLIGTPRIGKTAVLRQVQYLAHQKKQPAFYISLEGVTGREKLQASLYRHLRREKFDWFDCQSINFDVDLFKKADLFEALFELDRKLDGRPLFLLFDEAQFLVELCQESSNLLQEWRGALEMFYNIRTIFAALPRILKLGELMRDWLTSPFFNGLPTDELSVLTTPEAEALVKHPGIKLRPAQMAEILECADHHPFFLQVLCRALYRNGTLEKLTPAKFREAYHSVPLNGILLNAFAALNDEEKAVTQAVHQKGIANLRILRSAFPASRSLELTLYRLVSYGYLKKVNSGYKIINAFWSKWLEEEAMALV
jgi:AAA+ ATPase superfamily predicted ATPase